VFQWERRGRVSKYIKKDEMDGTCNAYGRDEKYGQNLGRKI
jgi:hypothetical protein